MPRTLETPEVNDLAGGGNNLQEEGTYHFIIEDIQDGKETNSGMLNGLFAKCKVLAGKHKDEVFNLDLLDPKLDSKDGGKFARVKQAAFCVAANLLTPEQINGGNVSYDEQDARGGQVVAEVRKGRESSDGKKYLDLHYSNVYHVDDPRISGVTKCQESLGIIPQNLRHDKSWFDSIIGQRKQQSRSTEPTDSDFDDI